MRAYSQKRLKVRMHSFVSVTLFLACWSISSSGWGQTFYVSDTTVEVNLRTGTSVGNRIIALLTPGTKVTVISEDEEWAEVTLEDGRTGWMRKKYISERPPWLVTAQRLATENDKLKTSLKLIEGSHRELVQKNSELKKEVDSQQLELKTVRQEYEDLKKSAANYLNLKMAYENLQTEARQSKGKLEQLQKAYDTLKMSSNIHWFLGGAGVLVVGWVVGLSMGRMKRKRSADLYRL